MYIKEIICVWVNSARPFPKVLHSLAQQSVNVLLPPYSSFLSFPFLKIKSTLTLDLPKKKGEISNLLVIVDGLMDISC